MSFRKTYAEILEMMQEWAFYTPNAREICRRAGVFPPRAGGGSGFPALTYVGNPDGEDSATVYDSAFYWEVPEPTQAAFWHWPGGVAKMVNRVDFSTCTEMRLTVHNRSVGPDNRVLWPIFQTEPSWDEIAGDTGGWLLADGSLVPDLANDFIGADLPDVQPKLALTNSGAYFTDWVPIPEAVRLDVFVGFAVSGETGDQFEIGYAQLQAR